VARLNIFSSKDSEKKSETIRANFVLENKNKSNRKQNKKNKPKNKAINQVVGGSRINRKTIKIIGIKNKGFFLDILTN